MFTRLITAAAATLLAMAASVATNAAGQIALQRPAEAEAVFRYRPSQEIVAASAQLQKVNCATSATAAAK